MTSIVDVRWSSANRTRQPPLAAGTRRLGLSAASSRLALFERIGPAQQAPARPSAGPVAV